MATRIFPKRGWNGLTVLGKDIVISAWAVPGDSTINNIWLNCHTVGLAQNIFEPMLFGIDGYILPLEDPDSIPTPDQLWDRMVPKESTTGTYDIDTATGQGDVSAFELDDLNYSELLDGLGEVWQSHFLEYRKQVTFASSPTGYDHAAQTYSPTHVYSKHVKANMHVRVPSWVLIGYSTPDTASATRTAWSAPSNEEGWYFLKYIEEAMRYAIPALLGLTSEGTGTHPFDEALTGLEDFLVQVIEDTAGRWDNITARLTVQSRMDVTVPGEIEVQNQISGAS